MNGILSRLLVSKFGTYMKVNSTLYVALTLCMLQACGNSSQSSGNHESAQSAPNISQRVEAAHAELTDAVDVNKIVVNLDHHGMAQEEGVYTPPSIATIFSYPAVNTRLIKANQLVALDLPFKTLCYTEADTSEVYLAWTSGDFISKRHALPSALLSEYDEQLSSVITGMEKAKPSNTNVDSVDLGFGIIEIDSDFDFATTIENLRNIVNAQSDTRWFGEVEFARDAQSLGEEIRPTTLLLFGGPAPGGKAMMTTPKIGLDAFCQKLLVYQTEEEGVKVAFNDIVAFSKLYYGQSTKPQAMINQRLTQTFTKAVTKS